MLICASLFSNVDIKQVLSKKIFSMIVTSFKLTVKIILNYIFKLYFFRFVVWHLKNVTLMPNFLVVYYLSFLTDSRKC